MNKGYIYLILSIILGCITNVMAKISNGLTKVIPSAIGAILILFVFYFFSQTLKTISMSITYITYFVSLILFTTFVGVYFYNETFNKYTLFGTILILSGITIIYSNKN